MAEAFEFGRGNAEFRNVKEDRKQMTDIGIRKWKGGRGK
jgi:hypothetical protein